MKKITDILKGVTISAETRTQLVDLENKIAMLETDLKNSESLLRDINLKTRNYIETVDKTRDKAPKPLSRMKLAGI